MSLSFFTLFENSCLVFDAYSLLDFLKEVEVLHLFNSSLSELMYQDLEVDSQRFNAEPMSNNVCAVDCHRRHCSVILIWLNATDGG